MHQPWAVNEERIIVCVLRWNWILKMMICSRKCKQTLQAPTYRVPCYSTCYENLYAVQQWQIKIIFRARVTEIQEMGQIKITWYLCGNSCVSGLLCFAPQFTNVIFMTTVATETRLLRIIFPADSIAESSS